MSQSTINFFALLIGLLIPVTLLIGSGYAQEPIQFEQRLGHDGSYASQRMYTRDSTLTPWRASNKPRQISDIQCLEAIRALREVGIWNGLFSESGECAESTETSLWTTGDYLNYKRQLLVAQQLELQNERQMHSDERLSVSEDELTDEGDRL
jgi:hypothetical protein